MKTLNTWFQCFHLIHRLSVSMVRACRYYSDRYRLNLPRKSFTAEIAESAEFIFTGLLSALCELRGKTHVG